MADVSARHKNAGEHKLYDFASHDADNLITTTFASLATSSSVCLSHRKRPWITPSKWRLPSANALAVTPPLRKYLVMEPAYSSAHGALEHTAVDRVCREQYQERPDPKEWHHIPLIMGVDLVAHIGS